MIQSMVIESQTATPGSLRRTPSMTSTAHGHKDFARPLADTDDAQDIDISRLLTAFPHRATERAA
jgi:hypothetical protein